MIPRPKYRAVVNFSCAGEHYTAGDPVPAGQALQIALGHGDQFVTADTKRAAATGESAQEPNTSATAEPAKEQ